ncbi:MAG: alkaline phosphatase D family protein [Flavobacteriales bacterium]
MKTLFTFVLISSLLGISSIHAQIQHALGFVGMRSARIWLATDQEEDVAIAFSLPGSKAPERIFRGRTQARQGFSCIIDVEGLEPGTTYNYRPFIDVASGYSSVRSYTLTTQELWQFRKEAPDFRMAVGSCTFVNEPSYDRPGDPYGGEFHIFDTIVKKDPDLMLWLGDNIYLREVDFESYGGIVHRYLHARSQKEIKNLLKHCPNIAIWDDHDFGPNDSNGSFVNKDLTLEAFKAFWPNPSGGISINAKSNGITTKMEYSDIDIFLLDNRYHRTWKDTVGSTIPTILGEGQLNWLLQSLKMSQAPFKLIAIGGQFLNSEAVYENYANYSEERNEIIATSEKENIRGVVFLTGDRHCGELSFMPLKNENGIYDLTVSPLTSRAFDMSKEANKWRIENTISGVRHFATLEFTGKKKHRVMTMNVFDSNGKLLWTRDVPQW